MANKVMKTARRVIVLLAVTAIMAVGFTQTVYAWGGNIHNGITSAALSRTIGSNSDVQNHCMDPDTLDNTYCIPFTDISPVHISMHSYIINNNIHTLGSAPHEVKYNADNAKRDIHSTNPSTRSQGYQALGRSLHYLEDCAQPFHTSLNGAMPTIALLTFGLDTSGGAYYPYHDKYEGDVAESAWVSNGWNNLGVSSEVFSVTDPESTAIDIAYFSNYYVPYLIGVCSLYDANTLKNDATVKSITQSLTLASAASSAGVIEYATN